MRIPDPSGNSWMALPKSSVSFCGVKDWQLTVLEEVNFCLTLSTQHWLEKVFTSSVTWVEKHKRGAQKSFCLYHWGILCLTSKFVWTYLSFTTVCPPANVHFDLVKQTSAVFSDGLKTGIFLLPAAFQHVNRTNNCLSQGINIFLRISAATTKM